MQNQTIDLDAADAANAAMPRIIRTDDGAEWYRTGYWHTLLPVGAKRHNRPEGTVTHEYFHRERGDAIRLHAFDPENYFFD